MLAAVAGIGLDTHEKGFGDTLAKEFPGREGCSTGLTPVPKSLSGRTTVQGTNIQGGVQ
jgi:hypothetical protein